MFLRIRIPIVIRFIVTYFCMYLIKVMTFGIDHSNMFIDILRLIIIAFCTVIFTYGCISIIDDFKMGGFKKLLARFKRKI